MSFKQIYNDGGMARTLGRGLRENPYYNSENLPVSESAAVYRAWQMKAEAWEQGWRERDQTLASALRAVPGATQPKLSADRRAIALSARAQELEFSRDAAGGVAA